MIQGGSDAEGVVVEVSAYSWKTITMGLV